LRQKDSVYRGKTTDFEANWSFGDGEKNFRKAEEKACCQRTRGRPNASRYLKKINGGKNLKKRITKSSGVNEEKERGLERRKGIKYMGKTGKWL